MNKLPVLLFGAAICFGFAGPYEDLVEERIKSPGRVCMEGESCGSGAAGTVQAVAQNKSSGPRTAAEIYQVGCAVCHLAGVGGAPRLSDVSAWTNRLTQGRDQLVHHAINGMGAMPPKGVCIDCSDEEVEKAVDYMLSQAGF